MIDYLEVDLGFVADRFDVVLDTVGNISIPAGRRLLTGRGVLLLAVADLAETIKARGNVKVGTSPARAADFEFLLELIEGITPSRHRPSAPPRRHRRSPPPNRQRPKEGQHRHPPLIAGLFVTAPGWRPSQSRRPTKIRRRPSRSVSG